MATWPTTLPSVVLADGYSERPVDITIRSSVDVGPAKLRPRYSNMPVDFVCPMMFTSAQLDTLDAFYESTLGFGSLRFDWRHPRKLTAATFEFLSRPDYQPLSGTYYLLTLNLRKWP